MKPFLFLFLIAASLLAVPEEKNPPKDREPKELVRDPASDFEGTARIHYVDGWRVLEYDIVFPKSTGTIRKSVHVVADPVTGMVKFVEVEPRDMPSDMALAFEQQQMEDEVVHRHDASTVNEKSISPDLPEPPDGGCPCGGGECAGNVIAWATTYDPLFWEMTKTSAAGGWKRFVNNMLQCKWISTGSQPYCTAYAPTGVGTNWYTAQPCSKTGPVTTPDGYWSMTALGQYKNIDFMSPLLYTYVQDNVQPIMSLGQFHIGGWHADQGEGANLLFALPNATLVNSCMR